MNREIVMPSGAGIYPLIGDIASQAGDTLVTVTGIQSIPVTSMLPPPGADLQYNGNTHNWTPTLRAAIQVNTVTASDDGLISVNVPKQTLVNGS
jgi:hypothetical protein